MTVLSQYFTGTACKYLSVVDATRRSNQHEIGSNKFTEILGNPGAEKNRFTTTFLLFTEEADLPEVTGDIVTYYDTRLNQPGRSPEYRLYYRDNVVTEQMREGDFCLVARRSTGELLIGIAPAGSDHERRLRFLFDIDGVDDQWAVGEVAKTGELDLASRSILDAIGIEITDAAEDLLDRLIAEFGMTFPTTKVFSAFARETVGHDIDAHAAPDFALEEWMKHEERLFRSLERVIVEKRLKKGFDAVESFISYSLSVQNRRKSRVGHALENHLEAVFQANSIRFERGAKTEGNSKPDFLFPGSVAYHDQNISSPPLQMLAAKSTCKDRWRQILAEAARIPRKHLFTLETAISEAQTDEMIQHSVQLVVPTSVAKTFTQKQQAGLMSLNELVQILPT